MDKQQIFHELTMRTLPQTMLHDMPELLVREYIETYAKIESAYNQIMAEKKSDQSPTQSE